MEKKVDLYGNVDFFFYTQLHCMVENVLKKERNSGKAFFPPLLSFCLYLCIRNSLSNDF